MSGHVSDERLMDLLEGGGGRSEREHARACGACAARLGEARSGLELARAAEVPEPSSLYWQAMRRGVGKRIAEEPRRTAWWSWLIPLAAAAAVVVYLSPRPEVAPAPPLPAWSALPPAEEDPGQAVLEGLAVADGGLGAWDEGRGLGAFVAGLSDEESNALVEALGDPGGGVEL